MPEPTIRIAVPYRPDADLTGTVYATVREVFGPDIEIVVDDERDQWIGDVLPYIEFALTYIGMRGLEALTDQGWQKLAGLVCELVRRGGRDDREVWLSDHDRRAVFVIDEAARRDARAMRAIPDVTVPDTGAEVVFRWDASSRCWRVDGS